MTDIVKTAQRVLKALDFQVCDGDHTKGDSQ